MPWDVSPCLIGEDFANTREAIARMRKVLPHGAVEWVQRQTAFRGEKLFFGYPANGWGRIWGAPLTQ